MSGNRMVRASRDGDQFHYLWASRRCLRLLSDSSGLVAISIEGSSPSEGLPDAQSGDSEEIIDIAEYYGSEKLEEATLIRYCQLKHSTYRAPEPWSPSGMRGTLHGFAERYRQIQRQLET